MSNASQIHPHPITEGDESLGESSQTRSKMEGSTSTRCSANDALDSFVPDALYNANGLKLVDFGSSKAKRKGGHGVRKRQQSYSFSVAQGNEVLTSKDTQVDIYPEKIKVLVNFLTNNNQILRDLRHPEHDNRVSEFQNVCARTVCDLPDTSVIKDVLHGFGWDSKSNKFKVNAETGSSSEDMLVSTLYSSLSQSLSTLYLTHLNRKRKEDLFSRIKGKTLEELDGPAVTDDKEAPWDEDATGEENNELLSDAALGNSFCPNILFHHLYEALYHRRVHQASRVNGSVYRRRRASNAPDRDNGCVTPPNGEIPSAYSNENSATPPYSILEMGVEEGSGSRGTQPKPKRQNSETPMIQSHLKATSTLFPGACVLADISGFTKLSCKYCLDGVDGLDRLHDTVSHFLGRFVQIVYAHRGDGKYS